MNLRNLSFFGAAALMLLASCNKSKTGSINDVSNATAGDSVMFYFGQNLASDFWLSTESDTTLRGENEREDYLRGVKAGIAAARENEAYNKGLFVGVQVAANLKDFREQFPNLKLDEALLLSSLRAGLESDSAVNENEVKSTFYKLMDQLMRDKEAEDAKAAEKLLAEEAAKLGLKLQLPMLYSKVVTPGDGAVVKNGDKVAIDVSAATLEGKMVGMKLPREVIVGRSYTSPMIMAALPGMKVGETKQFLSSAMEVTPRRYKLGEYKGTQLIKFTIHVSGVSASSPETATDSISQ
ncbi:MAG: hypothetical protein K2N03_06420 [Muribaculaceae bacterium]|nr:hypothetical protein [Muribaculaceae bacterium]